jgi:hypothetical protein
VSIEPFENQVLLDPFKEQLNLPPFSVHITDLFRIHHHVIRQTYDVVSFAIHGLQQPTIITVTITLALTWIAAIAGLSANSVDGAPSSMGANAK